MNSENKDNAVKNSLKVDDEDVDEAQYEIGNNGLDLNEIAEEALENTIEQGTSLRN